MILICFVLQLICFVNLMDFNNKWDSDGKLRNNEKYRDIY